MRIPPVERPNTWLGRIAYRSSMLRLGKVITPLKVVYARVPRALKVGYAVSQLMERGLSLDAELRLLLQTHVAQLNSCHFCVDIGEAIAMRTRVSLEKMRRLDRYETDERFTDAERAALRYVEQATRDKHVPDETFRELREHFSDQEIVEITLVNAVENFYNMVNIPLGIESDGLCALVPLSKRVAANSSTATAPTHSR